MKLSFRKPSNIYFYSVLRIRDILVRIWRRILRSEPLTNGFGCGSGRHKPPHKDIRILLIHIRVRVRNTVHLHHSSKIKSKKSHKTVEIKVFLTIFA
jgi:hypothetical protein